VLSRCSDRLDKLARDKGGARRHDRASYFLAIDCRDEPP
jgi:hypothetical protein